MTDDTEDAALMYLTAALTDQSDLADRILEEYDGSEDLIIEGLTEVITRLLETLHIVLRARRPSAPPMTTGDLWAGFLKLERFKSIRKGEAP